MIFEIKIDLFQMELHTIKRTKIKWVYVKCAFDFFCEVPFGLL